MNKKLKKIFCLFAVALIISAMAVPAFAADASYASDAVSAVQAGFNDITSTLTIGKVFEVLGVVIGYAVGFFFFWWGIRKIIRVVQKSFKSGKVSV